MEKQLISIIIPMYNAAAYLKRCLTSIRVQTYSCFEAICVDDGSCDATVELWHRIVGTDKRFQLIQMENAGVSCARNVGLDQARGAYITFVDSDDWIEPFYLELLYTSITENQVDIACYAHYVNHGDMQTTVLDFENRVLSREEALAPYAPYYFTAIWGKLLSKEVIKGLRFPSDIYYSEDTLFYTEAVLASKAIYWNKRPLYHYFINDQGALKQRNGSRYFTDFIARKRICEWYRAYPSLLAHARLRAVASAVNVLLALQLENSKQQDWIKELEEWIGMYGRSYRKSPVVSRRDKLLYLVAKHKPLFLFYRIFRNRRMK